MLETLIKFSVVFSVSSVLLVGILGPAHAAVGMNGGSTRYNGDSPKGGAAHGKDIKGKDANGVAGSLASLAIDSVQLPVTR